MGAKSATKSRAKRKVHNVGIIGYGPAFNMGALHIDSITANDGFKVTAVCDLNKDCLKSAKEKYPHIKTYTSVDTMLKQQKLSFAVIITPHCTHGPLSLKCLEAGVGVVTEKPMAITSAEVKAMLKAAKENGAMLSTFHNRRWDPDFVVLRDLVQSNIIGKIFRIEAGFNGYARQRGWWRSDKDVSGGAIYDWGAHFTDWILNLVDSKISSVTGFQAKHPEWSEYSNEDHSEYSLRFESGCLATLTISNLSMIERPKWTLRGEHGSIVAGDGHFVVKTWRDGRQWTTNVPINIESDWHAYYRNVCAHVRDGEPLIVTGESAARVIAVLDCADTSAEDGGKPKKPFIR